MDFEKQFESLFQAKSNYFKTDIESNKKLQDTRHALQESISENDQLSEMLDKLYSFARVENVATTELITEIAQPLFKNIPLPRNADKLPLSEKVGYTLYCMKFLGFALRKSLEEYTTLKEHLEGIHKSVGTNTVNIMVKRTGTIKMPELDGVKESLKPKDSKQVPSPVAEKSIKDGVKK